MTIKGESFSSAPTEHEVMSAYPTSAEPEIPIAYATTIESQSQSPPPYVSEPQTSSYSTGASNIAVPTGAPIIRAANQPATAVVTPQGGQTRAANDPCCCNGQMCCYISAIILTIMCLCCLLPFIIFLITAATAANVINEFDDAIFNDDVWRQIDQDFGN